jgi:hypothetical protein
MRTELDQLHPEVPFTVPQARFDQKNEMFKRSIWDEKMKPHGLRFYRDIKFKEKIGYRQMDYALQNAAWNLEWGFGLGNSRSNSGLYSWEGGNVKIKPYLDSSLPINEKFGPRNRSDCANCIRVCPFNKPAGKIHDFSRLLVRKKTPIFNRFLIWIDDILGYDKPVSAGEFWDSD